MPTPPRFKSLVDRPATVTLRFTDGSAYAEAVKNYGTLLNTVPKNDAQGAPLPLQSWQASAGTELRLSLIKGSAPQSFLYWSVKKDDTSAVADMLRAKGFAIIEQAEQDGAKPDNNPEFPVRTLFSNQASGDVVGIVINPPYPMFTKKQGTPPINPPANYSFAGGLMGGLLAGALLAVLARKLF